MSCVCEDCCSVLYAHCFAICFVCLGVCEVCVCTTCWVYLGLLGFVMKDDTSQVYIWYGWGAVSMYSVDVVHCCYYEGYTYWLHVGGSLLRDVFVHFGFCFV